MHLLWGATSKRQENEALDRTGAASSGEPMNRLGPVGIALQSKLEAAFSPVLLDIEDESAHHAGHSGAREGGESHFRVRIVSGQFSGLSRVERQRRVYAVLSAEFAKGLHALALTTQTPDEAR
jgi:BolA protein